MPQQVSEYEYLRYALTQTKIAEPEMIDSIHARFEGMDVEGKGFLLVKQEPLGTTATAEADTVRALHARFLRPPPPPGFSAPERQRRPHSPSEPETRPSAKKVARRRAQAASLRPPGTLATLVTQNALDRAKDLCRWQVKTKGRKLDFSGGGGAPAAAPPGAAVSPDHGILKKAAPPPAEVDQQPAGAAAAPAAAVPAAAPAAAAPVAAAPPSPPRSPPAAPVSASLCASRRSNESEGAAMARRFVMAEGEGAAGVGSGNPPLFQPQKPSPRPRAFGGGGGSGGSGGSGGGMGPSVVATKRAGGPQRSFTADDARGRDPASMARQGSVAGDSVRKPRKGRAAGGDGGVGLGMEWGLGGRKRRVLVLAVGFGMLTMAKRSK